MFREQGALSNFMYSLCAAFLAPLTSEDVSYQKVNEMSRNRCKSSSRQNRKKRRKKAAKKKYESQPSRSGGEILCGENEWAVDFIKGGNIKVRPKDKKVRNLWDKHGSKKVKKNKRKRKKNKHKRCAFLFTTTGVT